MSSSVFIYGYKRAPFNKLNDYLSRIHPGAALSLLVNNYFHNIKDFSLDDVTHLLFANANDISIGKNFTDRFAQELKLDRSRVQAFRFDQEHMSVFKSLQLISGLEALNFSLITAYENLTSVPDYIRNSFIQERPETPPEDKHEVIKGLLNAFTYIDEHQVDIWSIIQTAVTAHGITKDDCDKFAFTSRYKYIESFNKGWFKNEILPVSFEKEKPSINFELDLLATSYYSKEEYLTALALSETAPLCTRLNVATPADGSAMLLASSQLIKDKKATLEVVDFDLDYGDPSEFISLGIESMKRICKKNKVKVSKLDFYEFHESHPGIILAQAEELKIPEKK